MREKTYLYVNMKAATAEKGHQYEHFYINKLFLFHVKWLIDVEIRSNLEGTEC